jgi:hypothetical protein
MAEGLCVVAPNEPTMNEYIRNGENGLLYDIRRPRSLNFKGILDLGESARHYIYDGHERWLSERDKIIDFIFLNMSEKGKKESAFELENASRHAIEIIVCKNLLKKITRFLRKNLNKFISWTRSAKTKQNE